MTRTVVLVCLLSLGIFAQAKDLSDWNNLAELSNGEKVQVTRKGGSKVQGQFASSSATAATVETGHGSIAIPRDEIAAVAKRGGNKGKWIGAAAGAVAGAAGGAVLGTRLANEGQGDKAAITAGVAAAGAALGLLIGFGADGYKTIYEAK